MTAKEPLQAAPVLIAAEREAARAGDFEVLTGLWTAGAQIVDGRGTENPSDDYVWQGRSAILDRYRIAVQPAPPPPLDPAQLEALTVISTTHDSALVELGVDRWTLLWQDGHWQLSELRYN